MSTRARYGEAGYSASAAGAFEDPPHICPGTRPHIGAGTRPHIGAGTRPHIGAGTLAGLPVHTRAAAHVGARTAARCAPPTRACAWVGARRGGKALGCAAYSTAALQNGEVHHYSLFQLHAKFKKVTA